MITTNPLSFQARGVNEELSTNHLPFREYRDINLFRSNTRLRKIVLKFQCEPFCRSMMKCSILFTAFLLASTFSVAVGGILSTSTCFFLLETAYVTCMTAAVAGKILFWFFLKNFIISFHSTATGGVGILACNTAYGKSSYGPMKELGNAQQLSEFFGWRCQKILRNF